MTDEETDDVDVRHRFTNDGLAYVLVVANILLVHLAVLVGADVPMLLWQTFAGAVGLSVTWAFGKGTLQAFLGAVQDGGRSDQ